MAFTAATILGLFAQREGWEVRPRRRTWRARLDEWWISWLTIHFGLVGRERLARSHHRLESTEVWLSAPELIATYGPEGQADSHDPA